MSKIMNRNNIVVVIVGACQVDDPADFGGRLDRSTETQNDDGKQGWKWIFFLTRRRLPFSAADICHNNLPFSILCFNGFFFSLSLCYGRVHLISFRPVLIVLPPALCVGDDKLWLYNCKRVWGAGKRWDDDKVLCAVFSDSNRNSTFLPTIFNEKNVKRFWPNARLLSYLHSSWDGKSWSDDDEEQTSYKLKEKII